MNQLHSTHEPWNKGKLIGQKAPLKQRDIWAIRVRLELAIHKRLSFIQLGYRLKASSLRSGQTESTRYMSWQPDFPEGYGDATKDTEAGAV